MTGRLACVIALSASLGTPDAKFAFLSDSGDGAERITGRILYVDDDAPPTGDGRNWIRAFRHLQDALAKARLPESDVREIRIAGGLYRPDRGAGIAPGDRHATFDLVDGMVVRGGYRGRYAGPGNPSQRDFGLFESVLSGDLLQNDIYNIFKGGEATWLDNSFHVTRAVDHARTLFLDGLTIKGGNSNGLGAGNSGGGLYAPMTDLRLVDCRFERNHTYGYGAGIFASGATVDVLRCGFAYNVQSDVGSGSGYGGGIYATNCGIHITDSSFAGNEAALGGAVFAERTHVDAVRSSFNGSREVGIIVFDAGHSHYVDCWFIGNQSEGASALRTDGPLTLLRCTFRSNRTNIPGNGAAVVVSGEGPLSVYDCVFLRNYAYYGAWGLGHGDIPLTIVNTVFAHNGVSYGFAGYGPEAGGGSQAQIRNCTYADNSIQYPDDRSNAPRALHGPTAPVYANCIFWNNSPAMFPAGCGHVANSIVEGPCGGVGNIHADPLFVDAEADDYRLRAGSPAIDAGDNAMLPPDIFDLDGDGNFIEPLPLDLLGLPRFIDHPATPDTGNPAGLGGITDMGAYEAQP